MNAQKMWTFHYRVFIQSTNKKNKLRYRAKMIELTEQAALERIIARQAREIERKNAELELARTMFVSVLGLNYK